MSCSLCMRTIWRSETPRWFVPHAAKAEFVVDHKAQGDRLDFGRLILAYRDQFPFLVGTCLNGKRHRTLVSSSWSAPWCSGAPETSSRPRHQVGRSLRGALMAQVDRAAGTDDIYPVLPHISILETLGNRNLLKSQPGRCEGQPHSKNLHSRRRRSTFISKILVGQVPQEATSQCNAAK